MSELADETDSKSVASNSVWVQVPLSAPVQNRLYFCMSGFFVALLPLRRKPPAAFYACPPGKYAPYSVLRIEKKPMLQNVT